MLEQACAGQASAQGPKPLVVVGSINADLVLQVDRLPKEGETLGAQALNTFPGGKARLALSHSPACKGHLWACAPLDVWHACCGRVPTRRRRQRGCSTPPTSLAR